MSLLIKGGIIAEHNCYTPTDVLIDQGLIKKIGQIDTADQIIDARGMILFPGFIDAHTHFDMDTGTAHTADDFRTGTGAALSQGTTVVVDFATQNKGETLEEALDNWHEKAKNKCACHYAFHMAITDWNPKTKAEMSNLKEAGVTSYKLYMAYDALRVSDDAIYEVLEEAKALGSIVGMHCENGDLVKVGTKLQQDRGSRAPKGHPLSRPDTVEAEAISRFLDIAYMVDVPVHIVHLSTQKGLERIRFARARGQKVFVETCPQYLLLDESLYNLPSFEGAKYVLSPPLRTPMDQEALWEGLQKSEIQTISTDHCSFSFETQKKMGLHDFSQIPSGVPGAEHRPQLIYTYGVTSGQLSLCQMARLLSTNAAKLFGMYPRKGTLAVGSDADLVIWDPSYEGILTVKSQLQNVDYTPYEGFKVKGRAEHVFLGGEQVIANGKLMKVAEGQYVHRADSF